MILYTSGNSPFGARITIALRAKGIEVEARRPPAGGLRSAEYLAINPIAKIPVLITESGVTIPESEAILDYLEDRFPTPSLRPASPDERARLNVAIRVVDAYVMAPVIRTFPHLSFASRDERVVEQEVARWRDGLAALDHFMRDPLPEAQAGLSMADCALAPSLHLSTRIAAMLGLPDDPIQAFPRLVDYYAGMKSHPIVGPVLSDLTAVQSDYDIKSGRQSIAYRH